MARQRAVIHPQGRVLTIRIRVTTTEVPDGAQVEITDCLLQAGSTVTGWVPHVTELPWTAGIVGG